MRTNIFIDDELIGQFMRATGVTTKREAVHTALKEALLIRQQDAIMGLWGMGWEGDLEAMRIDKPLPEHG